MDTKHISLPPSVWGPIFWNTIHIVTLGYPVNPTAEEKEHVRMFFESLKTVIPCPICREHYKEHVKTMPIEPALEHRTALVEYGWTLHNKVNEMLDKPHYSQEQFLQHMKSLGSSRHSDPIKIGLMVAGGVVAGSFGMFLYQRMRK